MVLVSHGNVCRALLVSLLFRFGAVSALYSQFGFGSVCLEVPSFVEMIQSRGWRFLDVPSLLNVCPSPMSLVETMAALSLIQFGNAGMPSFLGDFFGAGYFMFDFKGLLWSFMLPVVVAAAMLAAAGRDVFVCGGAPLCVALPLLAFSLSVSDATPAALTDSVWYFFVQTEGLLFVCGAGLCQNCFLTGSWIDFYMLVNAPDFGMGKDKGPKISLFIQEVVKRSPFQVGIEAARQLGSCILVGISAAAQISVLAAALMYGCVSVAIDSVSLLCYVLLILVFKCVKEMLGALAAAAWDFAAALFAASRMAKSDSGLHLFSDHAVCDSG